MSRRVRIFVFPLVVKTFLPPQRRSCSSEGPGYSAFYVAFLPGMLDESH
jgi:hypothetical protein